jgi:hypothetical protein
MGLAFVGGQAGSDKRADLSRPQRRQGDKERWRQRVMENLTTVVHESLVSPLLVSLFSSFKPRTLRIARSQGPQPL